MHQGKNLKDSVIEEETINSIDLDSYYKDGHIYGGGLGEASSRDILQNSEYNNFTVGFHNSSKEQVGHLPYFNK